MAKKKTVPTPSKSNRGPIDDIIAKRFSTPDLKRFIDEGYFKGSGLAEALVDEYKTRKDKKK
jgi:hypothetical protein